MNDRMQEPRRRFGWPPKREEFQERLISPLILAHLGELDWDAEPPWLPIVEELDRLVTTNVKPTRSIGLMDSVSGGVEPVWGTYVRGTAMPPKDDRFARLRAAAAVSEKKCLS